MISFAKRLIWFEILYLMLSSLLVEGNELLRMSRFLLDPLTVLLVVCVLLSARRTRLKQVGLPLLAMGGWLAYMVLAACFKSPQLLPLLWAVRNWARGFALFAGCAVFLDQRDIFRFYRLFQGLYLVNFLAVLIQFFVYEKDGDFLGGIFGTAVGCNGYTNIFLCIMVTAELCIAFRDKELDIFGIFVLLSSMVIGALEEIKVFYFEFVFIVALVCLLCALRKQADRKLLIKVIFWAAVAYVLGLLVIYLVFPRHFAVLTGQKSYSRYEETSRVSYKISRVKFISEINELIFHGSLPLNLFGFGLGTCEYSKFSLFIGRLYPLYGDLNYHFFSHQPLFLEGGLVGLGLYLLILLVQAVEHFRTYFAKTKFFLPGAFGAVFALVCLVNVIYNNAFRSEASYLIYFALAASYLAAPTGSHEQH